MTMKIHRAYGFEISIATPNDRHEARHLHERAFSKWQSVYRFTGEALARQELRFDEGTRLVARSKSVLAGTLQFRSDAHHIHLLGIAVAPEYQHRGIARAMVAFVAELAPSLGHRTLALDTIVETGNVQLFERMGFALVRTETAQDCVSDRYESLHLAIMETSIHSASLCGASADTSRWENSQDEEGQERGK